MGNLSGYTLYAFTKNKKDSPLSFKRDPERQLIDWPNGKAEGLSWRSPKEANSSTSERGKEKRERNLHKNLL